LKEANQSYWGLIKDPIFGYIQITDLDRKIIDTNPVQRLRRIRQLAGSEYVYPGANHSRFEHSLGVMHLSRKLSLSLSSYLGEEERTAIEIGGLLHDVGHGPFSHVFEPILMKYLGKTHEDFTSWIIGRSEIADVLRSGGFNPDDMMKLAIGKLGKPDKVFLDQIISSSMDVDKMDFILRDSYHTGAGYGNIDVERLIYTMSVFKGELALNAKALPALETFLLARLQSFRTIYFHRTVRAIQIMIWKAMDRANEELHFVSFKSPEDYLEMDDHTTWTLLKKCKRSRPLMEKLERRELLKCAYEKAFFLPDEFTTSVFSSDSVRSRLEEEIAREAKIDRDSVVIDVPTLSSLPYRYPSELKSITIPLFSESRDGKRTPQRIEDLSPIAGSLQAFINMLRVYTEQRYRDRVAEVVEKVIGPPPSTKISS